MNFVLILVAIASMSPESPSMFAHSAFATMAQCEAKRLEVKASMPEGVKVASFCVSLDDLKTPNK